MSLTCARLIIGEVPDGFAVTLVGYYGDTTVATTAAAARLDEALKAAHVILCGNFKVVERNL